jgi:hypothetical protein
MKLKNIFSLVFTPPPPVPKNGEKEEKTLRRKVVSQISSGSVLLQTGRYATEEDLVARKKKVLAVR